MNDLAKQMNSPAQLAVRMLDLIETKRQVDAELLQIRESLLETTRSLGVLTLKTDTYTICRSKRLTTDVVDVDELAEWFTKEGMTLTTKRVPDEYSQGTIKESIKCGKIPDGIEVRETEYVSIRTNKEK